jgi:hypothetical protein
MRLETTPDKDIFLIVADDGRVASYWKCCEGNWHACLGNVYSYKRDRTKSIRKDVGGPLAAQAAAMELLLL